MSLPNKFFNLLFVDDSVHKIAYASSFGVSEIPSFQRKETGLYLDRFYRIVSVKNVEKRLWRSFPIKKRQSLPTYLLLTREEWEAEISEL